MILARKIILGMFDGEEKEGFTSYRGNSIQNNNLSHKAKGLVFLSC